MPVPTIQACIAIVAQLVLNEDRTEFIVPVDVLEELDHLEITSTYDLDRNAYILKVKHKV